MGEIGRDRSEYLYEMSYCDIYLIQRGYRRRNILQYQLQRLQAYGAFHCMGAKNPKEPHEWLPMYIDRYIEDGADGYLPDKSEVDEMLAEMAAINEANGVAVAQQHTEQNDSKPAT